MKMRGASVAVLVGFVISVFVLTFQNCGKPGSNGSSNSASSAPAYASKEIIVRMKDTSSENDLKGWAVSNGLVLKNAWPLNNTTHWAWSAPMTVQQVQASLAATALSPNVVFSEPNYYVQSIESPASTLMSWGAVQALSTSAQVQTTVNIQESAVWTSLPSGNSRPIIAIIDTGLDLTHVAFTGSNAIWKNPGEIPGNGIDDDGNGYVDDVNGWNWVDNNNNVQDTIGHGTHCAGIALGVGQNIFLNPPPQSNIQIMPLKFIGPNGGLTSDAINAVYYAVAKGAKVLSNSWGGSTPSMALEDAITYAYNSNVLFVAAAGNSSLNNDVSAQYPANYTVPNVISVAATDANDKLASFSDYGIGSVNFGSPGVSIFSTYPPNSFAYLSGTSMATPFVSGTAIYMMYARPQLGGYQAKNIILTTPDPAPALAGYTKVAGRLNSLSALNIAKTVTIDNTRPAFTEKIFSSQDQGIGSSGGGGGCGVVADVGKGGRGGNGPDLLPVFVFCVLLPLGFNFWLRKRHWVRN